MSLQCKWSRSGKNKASFRCTQLGSRSTDSSSVSDGTTNRPQRNSQTWEALIGNWLNDGRHPLGVKQELVEGSMMFNTSEETAEITKALVAAQEEMPAALAETVQTVSEIGRAHV